jgi:hypothetical protein
MEAGIELGFTALMAAAVSGGQHRDRASRPQKLYENFFFRQITGRILGAATPPGALVSSKMAYYYQQFTRKLQY